MSKFSSGNSFGVAVSRSLVLSLSLSFSLQLCLSKDFIIRKTEIMAIRNGLKTEVSLTLTALFLSLSLPQSRLLCMAFFSAPSHFLSVGLNRLKIKFYHAIPCLY